MPKMKTHRGAAKRFRKTGGAKIKRGTAFRRHLLSSKDRGRKRGLRQTTYVDSTNVDAVLKLLPNK